MLFLFLIQRLCYKASVPEIPDIDERVVATVVLQTRMIKDPKHSDLPKRPRVANKFPMALYEGTSIPTEPINNNGGDMAASIQFGIGEQREALELSTQVEGTPSTSTLFLTSASNLVGAY